MPVIGAGRCSRLLGTLAAFVRKCRGFLSKFGVVTGNSLKQNGIAWLLTPAKKRMAWIKRALEPGYIRLLFASKSGSLTAFSMVEVVTDWNDERSESSKFSGGAIWCHLASPENGLDVGTFAEPN